MKPAQVHIAIDLETASIEPDAAIVQIGAARIHPTITLAFSRHISLVDNERHGRSIDIETMEWWDKQDPQLRKRVFSGTLELSEALDQFIAWCESQAPLSEIYLWGNGSDFDCTILKSAIEVYGTYPFDFRKHRDMRTLLGLVNPDVVAAWKKLYSIPRVPHDAMDDAIYQSYLINKGLEYVLPLSLSSSY